MDRPRLLLVEDDGMACSLMQDILAPQGLSVMTARTVAEGLALLESRPDYLILDLSLPDGDGRDVLERVRQAGRPIRVVVTSGWDEPHGLDDLRPDAVLVKPFSVAGLLNGLGLPR
ncbi:MAG TPA: response regulator [Isosphaeraceae bacterium]|jgi:DNA-binding response OmpR family regulator